MKTTEFAVPENVKAFGKTMEQLFVTKNPEWYLADQEYDDWDSHEGYDLNLYVCDGRLVVTVYPLIDDGTGFMTTNTSVYKNIIIRQERNSTQ